MIAPVAQDVAPFAGVVVMVERESEQRGGIGTAAEGTSLALFDELPAPPHGRALAAAAANARRVWGEVDLDAATWTIPVDRMKAKSEHRVPRARQCVESLNAAKDIADGDLVFPSLCGRQLFDATMSKLVRELGLDVVPHGLRSSFRGPLRPRTPLTPW